MVHVLLVLLGVLSFYACATVTHLPEDESCLLQVGAASVKAGANAALQNGAEVKQVPLGTNVAIKLPLKESGTVKLTSSLSSHPLSQRDAFILQISSKTQRRADLAVDPPDDQCASFVLGPFLCALLNHENAFAVITSTSIFVLLAVFWIASCFSGLGCDYNAKEEWLKRQHTPDVRAWCTHSSGNKDIGVCRIDGCSCSTRDKLEEEEAATAFTRQHTPEDAAVRAFTRQFTPEATTPELWAAFHTFKKSISPESQDGVSKLFLGSRYSEAFKRSITPNTEDLMEAVSTFKEATDAYADPWKSKARCEKKTLKGQQTRYLCACGIDGCGCSIKHMCEQGITPEAEAVRTFAKQNTPEATTSELRAAFHSFKRSITPPESHDDASEFHDSTCFSNAFDRSITPNDKDLRCGSMDALSTFKETKDAKDFKVWKSKARGNNPWSSYAEVVSDHLAQND